MKLTARASVEIPSPPEQVFDFATSCEGFPRFIWAYGPIPGIIRAEMRGGQPPQAGAERSIHMTDGNVIEEELLAYDRPSRHRYRWLKPPAFPFSLIVRTAEGDWRFTAANGGTRIDWDYSFELTSSFAWPFAALLMSIFRRWMQRTLLRARSVLAAA
ncbi:MAG TPA: SRPBCC family protein [Solimonas sp.]|nr:SRPBCC family protein [Solimonas sp.]